MATTRSSPASLETAHAPAQLPRRGGRCRFALAAPTLGAHAHRRLVCPSVRPYRVVRPLHPPSPRATNQRYTGFIDYRTRSERLWREKKELAQAYLDRVRTLCVSLRHKESQRRACIDSRMLYTTVDSPCQTLRE